MKARNTKRTRKSATAKPTRKGASFAGQTWAQGLNKSYATKLQAYSDKIGVKPEKVLNNIVKGHFIAAGV